MRGTALLKAENIRKLLARSLELGTVQQMLVLPHVPRPLPSLLTATEMASREKIELFSVVLAETSNCPTTSVLTFSWQ